MSILKDAIGGVTDFLGKKSDNKRAVAEIDGKVALAKSKGEDTVNVATAEWEKAKIASVDKSWKDEAVTVIILGPVVFIMAGVLWEAFTGDATFKESALEVITVFKEAGINYGYLLFAVVTCALGLKLKKG